MTVKKINKAQAKREFDKGTTLYLLPSKMGFNNCWMSPYRVNKNEIEDSLEFDKIVNNFSTYNCNTELGKVVSFYIESESIDK